DDGAEDEGQLVRDDVGAAPTPGERAEEEGEGQGDDGDLPEEGGQPSQGVAHRGHRAHDDTARCPAGANGCSLPTLSRSVPREALEIFKVAAGRPDDDRSAKASVPSPLSSAVLGDVLLHYPGRSRATCSGMGNPVTTRDSSSAPRQVDGSPCP